MHVQLKVIVVLLNFRINTKGAEWLARWTQAQKGLGLNSRRDAVG